MLRAATALEVVEVLMLLVGWGGITCRLGFPCIVAQRERQIQVVPVPLTTAEAEVVAILAAEVARLVDLPEAVDRHTLILP